MSSEERVRKGAEKLSKFLNAKQQGRLDGFFTAQPKTSSNKGKDKSDAKGKGKGTKRKVRLWLLVPVQAVVMRAILTHFYIGRWQGLEGQFK